MRDYLYDIDEVAALIRRGGGLLLAGEEAVLQKLPHGNWIGGTIPYFMTKAGGLVDRQRIFVNELPAGLQCAGIRRYGKEEITRVYADMPAGTLGVLIAPASSEVHLRFALDAPTFPGFASRPLIGGISGVHLSELGAKAAKVYDGSTGEAMTHQAVVMQIAMPQGKHARIGILNIFKPGAGPSITFPTSGFSATEVDIDGTKRNLAEYINATKLDTRLPLVADYCGLDINVSFQSVDSEKGEVKFYAPVFANVPYRHALPVADYVSEFVSKIPKNVNGNVAFSCNCILNYLYSGLEGKKTGDVACPITFGEVAYQLLNQTLAYVTVD
jgi:Family of unknown function (DUF6976)